MLQWGERNERRDTDISIFCRLVNWSFQSWLLRWRERCERGDAEMKHKHAELIKAWADGAQIQRLEKIGLWNDLKIETSIDWEAHAEYRIKPEEKQPVVRWLWAKEHIGGEWMISPVFRSKEEASKTFDGQVICLEYTRQEFPE
jgi:hypothetical protein